ncbi:MAG: hypothetical protein ABIS15_01135 [Gemmatimonadaceae bacterium]
MQDKPVSITALPGDFVAAGDANLFEFINSLRRSVRAKVAAGQQRGLSLGEIVVEVREMVAFAEANPTLPAPFPPHAYRAISREAVAWCIEAYQPTAFTADHQFVAEVLLMNTTSALQLLATAPDIAERAPARSPITRGTS